MRGDQLLGNCGQLRATVRVQGPNGGLAHELLHSDQGFLGALGLGRCEVGQLSVEVEHEDADRLTLNADGVRVLADEHVIDTDVLSECLRLDAPLTKRTPPGLLLIHLGEAADPTPGVLRTMSEHMLSRHGFALQALILGLIISPLSSGLGAPVEPLLSLFTLANARRSRLAVTGVEDAIRSKHGDEPSRLTGGLPAARRDKVGFAPAWPMERVLLLQHEPPDAQGIHRSLKDQRVDGEPQFVDPLVDSLVGHNGAARSC